MFLLFLFCTTKLGEISDIAKCFENFVSQTLGFLASFFAAELRIIAAHSRYERITGGDDAMYNVDNSFRKDVVTVVVLISQV